MIKIRRLSRLSTIKLQLMVRAQRRVSGARSATSQKIHTLKKKILISRMTILMKAIEIVPLGTRINIIIGLAAETWELSMI